MRLFEGTPFDRPLKCEQCDELEENCVCPPPEKELTSPEKQSAMVTIEKRKKGKQVTIIRGLPASENDLPNLLATLKNICGAGGTLKGDKIEVQGNHTSRVIEALKKIGYRVTVR